jgi:hypothetical protein
MAPAAVSLQAPLAPLGIGVKSCSNGVEKMNKKMNKSYPSRSQYHSTKCLELYSRFFVGEMIINIASKKNEDPSIWEWFIPTIKMVMTGGWFIITTI